MEASQNPQFDPPSFFNYDTLRQESKNLISSLPLDNDYKGDNLCNYQGFWYFYNTLQAVLDVQKHFQPQDTDIILASFPKSGTTWLKSFVFALVERGKYHVNSENHPLLTENAHNLIPFLELHLYFKNKIPDLTKFSTPRLFSTHMPLLELRQSVKDSPCKIVYLCRNPKDMLVSAWQFYSRVLNRESNSSSLEAIVDAFCRGVYDCGPFWDHVLSYWKESLENPKRVLFLTYEEMKKEPQVQLKRLAEFLGCPFSEVEEQNGLADEISELCSLRSLSNLEVNKTGKGPLGADFKTFFRKGEVGDWKNHMTSDMGRRIDEIIEAKLQGSGLKFK